MRSVPATHPTSEELAAFGLGKLSEPRAAAVARHLESCDACRKTAASVPPDSFLGLVRDADASTTRLPQGRVETAVAGATPAPAAATRSTAPELPPELRAHTKYEIVRALGHGGMGSVYLAKHRLMQRRVAIKVMSRELLHNADAVRRFQNEIMAVAQLSHPNIVTAHDAEPAGELQLFVMEFVEGQQPDRGTSLEDVLRERGPLPVAMACRYILQAALGLQHAFEKGILHRDIKPSNLMLARSGQIKVADFGLTRLRDNPGQQTGQTKLGSFMGTPDYVAPEQASDASRADVRSDIYSLGCTLYCLLAGRPPFQAESTVQLVLAHLDQDARPLTELRSDVSEGLWAVVARMMAKKPEDRFQKPEEAAQALAPFCKARANATPSKPSPSGGTPNRGTMIASNVGSIAERLSATTSLKADSPFSAMTSEKPEGLIVPQPGESGRRSPPRNSRRPGGGVVLVGLGAFGFLVVGLFGLFLRLEIWTTNSTVKLNATFAKASIRITPPDGNGKATSPAPVPVENGTSTRRAPAVAEEKEPSKSANPEPTKTEKPEAVTRLPESEFTPLSGEGYWTQWRKLRFEKSSDWDFGPSELRISYHPKYISDNSVLASQRRDFQDFTLRLEVKLDSEAFFGFRHLPEIQTGNPAYPVNKGKGYGVYLADHKRSPRWPQSSSGSLFFIGGHMFDEIQVVQKADQNRWRNGQWNTLELTVQGNSISIVVNDSKVTTFVDDQVRFRQGGFTLTPMKGGDLNVRNIRIKEWTTATIEPIQTTSLLSHDKDFVPLFNGKDLTGWKTSPEGDNSWSVDAGMLTGRGQRSHLFTEADRFENFHLRVEARINQGGNSGLFFRSLIRPDMPVGYEVEMIRGYPRKNPNWTGTLHEWGPTHTALVPIANPGIQTLEGWFVLEVIANNNQITVLVDGKKMVDHLLSEPYRMRGHLAVQQLGLGTVVEFRKIEIKELPASKPESK